MKVNFKKLHENAKIPSYARPGDAGLDMTATEMIIDYDKNQIKYKTGIAIELPKNHVGLLFPRSSIFKYNLALSNAVGVADSGYRGEISFIFNIIPSHENNFYKVGDRIGQLLILPYPVIELNETDVLTEAERGERGHGSTGH